MSSSPLTGSIRWCGPGCWGQHRCGTAAVPRLHRGAVGYACGISSASRGQHGDLGPGCALRPGRHQRRADHLVGDMERGGRKGRQRHRRAPACALRRLARSGPAIIAATPSGSLIRNDIYDRRPGRTWARGRVALVGDAVHPMTPDLAQGACQAIVDATTLAGYLAASRDTRAALQAYQKRRRRNAATTTLISRAIGAVGQWKGSLTCAVRDTLMRATPAAPATASARPHPRRRPAGPQTGRTA